MTRKYGPRDPYEVCAEIINGSTSKFDGCLIWQGAVNDRGYGYAKVNNKQVQVHRHVALYHVKRSIEQVEKLKKFRLKQTCGYTLCVAPEHLEFVVAKPPKVYVPMYDWREVYGITPERIRDKDWVSS